MRLAITIAAATQATAVFAERIAVAAAAAGLCKCIGYGVSINATLRVTSIWTRRNLSVHQRRYRPAGTSWNTPYAREGESLVVRGAPPKPAINPLI
jgi:hypothetical protein